MKKDPYPESNLRSHSIQNDIKNYPHHQQKTQQKNFTQK